MSWKKHFSPVENSSDSTLLTNKSSTSKPGPARANYSSYLPDIYTGSPNRVERYSQYETMDSDPEVNAALDILAEFCTQKLKDGKSPFNIKWRHKATNTEVRILGEYLQQWNKLQLFDTRIFRIVRNVFKYGDGFFIRDPETQKWNWIDPTKIVKILVNESDGKKPTQYVIKDLAPNFENLVVTQITPNVNPRQNSGSKVGAQSGTSGAYPTSSSGSKWGLGETEYAIDAEHVIHLSLSEGLDNNYPFGNSLLENVFKVYKQKELLEDAILIYRIQRAPERRVFHIDVGNMPSHLAMAFVERVKNEIHQRRIPSQTGGGCFVMSTRVPLLDGRTLSITELADEYAQGKENWAYSCNPETREMVPGIITWAGVTQKSAKVMELTLDNGEVIICTPEHTFPIVGKGKIEAKDIAVNEDSLVSFSTRLYSINEKNNANDPQYHQYYEHTTNKWTFTHRTVANFFKAINLHNELVYDPSIVGAKKVIHHVDFNKYNKPDNLWFMNGYDHFLLHSKEYGNYYNTLSADEKQLISDKKRKTVAAKSADEKAVSYSKISDGNKLAWQRMKLDIPRFERRKAQLLSNLTFSDEPWQNQTLNINARMHAILIESVNHGVLTKQLTVELLNNNAEFMNIYTVLNLPEAKKIYKLTLEITTSALDNIISQCGYASWVNFLKCHGRKVTRPAKKLKWNDLMLKILVDGVARNSILYKTTAYAFITADTEFLSIFKKLNPKVAKFTNNTFGVFLSDMGFSSWDAFMTHKENFNHKVIAIRMLTDYQEVGTLTIDGNEKCHNFHTFAIEQGIYTYNSNVIDSSYNTMSMSEDYFFPKTSEGRGSDVTTLPGGCFAMDTKVSLLDGRELSIADIEIEMKAGKELWTYSCEPKTGKIVPGLISWAGVTHKSAKVMKLTLDNGETIICTPCHKFPIYGSEFKRAGDFVIGESLIPLYRKSETKLGKNQNDYEQVFDNASNTWQYTHRVVADFLKDTVVKYKIHDADQSNGKYEVRHHLDYNRYNNDPHNLCFMSWHDHRQYHQDNIQHMNAYNKKIKETDPVKYAAHRAKISDGLTRSWKGLSDDDKAFRISLISDVWKNHTEAEYELRCSRIGSGIHEYVENLSIEDRELRAIHSRVAFKLGNIKFNEMMDSDLAFRESVIAKRKEYWTDDTRQIRSDFMTEQNKEFWTGDAGEIRRAAQKSLQSVEYSHAMLLAVIDLVKGKTTHQVTANDVVNEMNNNLAMLTELRELNEFKKVRNWSLNDGFTATGLGSLVKQFGYAGWKDFRIKESIHNHRVINIEYLDEEIEVGTLTIDSKEVFHDYHTFALTAGVMCKNSNIGEIDDLKYFTNKLFRGLRIPSSYLPTGADDSQASFNDGRVGTAYIQELRFNKYCERLQSLLTMQFDEEFKMYIYSRGLNIDVNLFELEFNPPMNFASSRQISLDSERINTFNTIQAVPYMSKRFALKRFLGLTDEEIAENERSWGEEQGKGEPTHTDAAGELRSAGLSAAGIAGDFGAAGDMTAPDDLGLEGGMPAEPGAAPVPAAPMPTAV
jgi:Bacteriophage T4-like portal protein (Gp20)